MKWINWGGGLDVSPTITKDNAGGNQRMPDKDNFNALVEETHYIARRLTTGECGALQGMPQGWCDIGEWTDEKGKVHKDADSPKYRAFGNGINVPTFEWIFNRMAKYLPENATMGSLFDGIGSFPLIWERIHGKGTALWSSEIEQFPMAVTALHFPEK